MARPSRGFLPSGGWGINAHPSVNMKAVASAAWKIGAVLGTNTFGGASGTSTEVSAYASELFGGLSPNLTASGGILGVAEGAGPNATDSNTYARFVPAIPGVLFEGYVDDATGTGAPTIRDTQVMKDFSIARDASGYWYIDLSRTLGQPCIRIVSLVDAAGTANGRLRFEFLPKYTQFNAS